MTVVRVGSDIIDINSNTPPRPFIGWNAKIKFDQLNMFDVAKRLSATEKVLSFSEQVYNIKHDAIFSPRCQASCGKGRCKQDHICGIRPLSSIFNNIYHLGYLYRTREYGFYQKGFEKDLTLPLGREIRWVETFSDGSTLVATLRIPKDLEVCFSQLDGKVVRSSMQDAYGLGIVKDISKLRLKHEDFDFKTQVSRWTVEFDSSINPETDIEIIDVLRSSDDAVEFSSPGLYPLRPKAVPSRIRKSSFYSDVRGFKNFMDDATGWHGSLSCEHFLREIEFNVGLPWLKESAVAVMER